MKKGFPSLFRKMEREQPTRVVEHCGYVAFDVFLLQPIHVHAGRIAMTEDVRQVSVGRRLGSDALSDRADDENAAAGDLADPVTHHLERRRVGVVQVVEDEDARSALRSEREDANQEVEQSVIGRSARGRRRAGRRHVERWDRPYELAERGCEPRFFDVDPRPLQ
jgi:hypothetical protein